MPVTALGLYREPLLIPQSTASQQIKTLAERVSQASKISSQIRDPTEKLEYVVVSRIEETDFEAISSTDLEGFEKETDWQNINIEIAADLEIDNYTNYQTSVVCSYLSEGMWNLEELGSQLIKDLPRSFVKVNGAIQTSFSDLCSELGIELFSQNRIDDSSISSQQRKILYFMSMLQQGAVAEALKYTYCDLPEALQGLIISHVSGDRKLTNIAKSIINTSKDDPYLAFRLCRKECSLYPDLAKYLASAVFIGLLDEKVFPRWKTVENPLPIYPTRYSGVCKPGAPVTLTIDQDMQLTEVVRDMITSSPMAIKVEVEVGKKASVTWQII